MTKEKIEEILKVALYTPSAFGMQSARMIVVTGDENKKLWDIAKAEVKKTLPEGQDFKPTEDKLNGFAAGFDSLGNDDARLFAGQVGQSFFQPMRRSLHYQPRA